MKRKALSLLLLSTLIGCTTISQTHSNKMKILSIPNDITSSASPAPYILPKELSKNQIGKVVKFTEYDRQKQFEKEKYKFDFLPPENSSIAEGRITVIFRNEYKIRVSKDSKKIHSIAKTDLSRLDEILGNAGLISSYDLGNVLPDTDEKLNDMQSNYMRKHSVDIPHLRSIHYYKVSKETNTKELCKEIMKLPYVRLAYPTSKINNSAEHKITNVGYNQLTNNSTPDFLTDSVNSNNPFTNYYWFNQHNIFKAKDYYRINTSQKPKIAFIDTGFDPQSPELNTLPGFKVEDKWYYIKPKVIVGPTDCPNNICVKSTDSESHGNSVAYVAAGINNGATNSNSYKVPTTYGEGVAEGSYIVPINVDMDIDSIVVGISLARSVNVDAINISKSKPNGDLLTFESDVNAAVSYAVDENIPVVIAAGNTKKALNPPTNYFSDAIVVGGTQPLIPTFNSNKYIRFDNGNVGTNYFDRTSTKNNPIDIAAAAHSIYYLHYDGTNNTRGTGFNSGTSVAVPMVSATAAMMKKLNPNLTARQIKDIIIYSSNLREFSTVNTNFIIGKDLEESFINTNYKAGIRDLNTYNALVIAKNLTDPNFVAISRTYNADDSARIDHNYLSMSFSSPDFAPDFGDDTIWGITATSEQYINYGNYNNLGDCAFGFQVFQKQYSNHAKMADLLGGVVGSVGIPCTSTTWHNNISYQIQ